jgi:hypothetical protein
MSARGKKSSAALAVVTALPGQRPAPPDELTQDQADVWKMVVATKPVDWFTPDTHKLLISYCKHATTARVLDEQIDNFDPAWLTEPEGLLRYKELTGIREKQTRALTALSRSMRLTHQSVYRPEKANAKTAVTKKPWEK